MKWQISGRKAVSGVETSEPGMAAPVPEVAASDAEIDRYLALLSTGYAPEYDFITEMQL